MNRTVLCGQSVKQSVIPLPRFATNTDRTALLERVLALSVDTDAPKESLWRVYCEMRETTECSEFLEISTHYMLWYISLTEEGRFFLYFNL